MMKLLDIIICLEDAQKLGHSETLSAKWPFEKNFGGGKYKFCKRKYEVKGEVEGIMSSKPQTPKH